MDAYMSSNGDTIFLSKGSKNTTINVAKFINGSVADYELESPLVTAGKISILNKLYNEKEWDLVSPVEAVTNIPGKYLTLAQSVDAVYTINSAGELN